MQYAHPVKKEKCRKFLFELLGTEARKPQKFSFGGLSARRRRRTRRATWRWGRRRTRRATWRRRSAAWGVRTRSATWRKGFHSTCSVFSGRCKPGSPTHEMIRGQTIPNSCNLLNLTKNCLFLKENDLNYFNGERNLIASRDEYLYL